MATKSVADYLKQVDDEFRSTTLYGRREHPGGGKHRWAQIEIKKSDNVPKAFKTSDSVCPSGHEWGGTRTFEGPEVQPPKILNQVFLKVIFSISFDYKSKALSVRTPWIPLLGSTDIYYERGERKHDKLMNRICERCQTILSLEATNDEVSKAVADVKEMLESGILNMKFNPKGNYANFCRAIVDRMGGAEGWDFSYEFRSELGIDTHPALAPRA